MDIECTWIDADVTVAHDVEVTKSLNHLFHTRSRTTRFTKTRKEAIRTKMHLRHFIDFCLLVKKIEQLPCVDLWSNHYVYFYRTGLKEKHVHTHLHTNSRQAHSCTYRRWGVQRSRDQSDNKMENKSKRREGNRKKKMDTTVENRQFDWGAQMHLSCTIFQSSGGKKKRWLRRKDREGVS